MSRHEMETLLRNIDLRTARIEHMLPTLATREEFGVLATRMDLLATKEELAGAIAPLATKEELASAIAPLATRHELREGLEEVRRHAKILNEDVRDDIRMLAEHLAGLIDQREQDR
ncbi:MAG: hypothetical protein ABL993_02880 [Vicinamibacterales bacterium]